MRPDSRTVGQSEYDRRQFLGLLAGALLLSFRPTVQQSDSLPGTGPAGRLYQPQWAGRPADPVTARDNLLAIQEIEKRLKCTCGCGLDIYTCRTTDFSCSYSPALHREVLGLYEAGKSGQEIVDDFVRRHGVTILMAPPTRGFNLTAYFVPGLVILIAAGILTFVLRRWTQRQAPPPAVPAPAGPPTGSPAELARLRDELEQLDA